MTLRITTYSPADEIRAQVERERASWTPQQWEQSHRRQAHEIINTATSEADEWGKLAMCFADHDKTMTRP